MAMSLRKLVIGAALVVVGLPVVLILIVVGTYYALFYVPNRAHGRIVSSGQEREYLLHVPPSYDPSTPTPLVISLHAAMLWPATQMDTSRWNRLADEQGFIVVYPSGRALGGAGTGVLPKAWFLSAEVAEMRDVRFIADLIDTLESAYNIDTRRIYANGFSLGGAMTFALSCTLSHRIAAVGAVAAAQTLPWEWCGDSSPVPMIAFHGTADPMVPYSGGPSKDPFNPMRFPDVQDWAADWARRNRCAPNPVESVVAADVARLEYTDCADDAAVVLYTINGGGHSWPGGKPMPEWIVGSTSHSIAASRQMWAFFREHPFRKE